MEPEIPLGSRFWPLTLEERTAVEELFETEAVRSLMTVLRQPMVGGSIMAGHLFQRG